MNCQAIKKLIPIYLDGELELQEHQSVKDHLAGCPICQKEVEMFEKSWAMLNEFKDIKPEPGYIGRFWTRLSYTLDDETSESAENRFESHRRRRFSREQSWQEKILAGVREVLSKKQLVPALVTACIVVTVGSFSLHHYFQIQGMDQMLAGLSEEDLKMVQNMELAENFDLIQEIDFLEDLDIIENLDILET